MAGEDLQFRERAVDSASSPESINRIAPIAPPRLWLVVIGIAAIVAAFLAWGIFGHIPITVRGTGILIEGTMVVAAESPVDGRIQEVRARPGDMVSQGDVIAVVASPALESQFADAQATAARLREQDAAMTATEETAIAAAVSGPKTSRTFFSESTVAIPPINCCKNASGTSTARFSTTAPSALW